MTITIYNTIAEAMRDALDPKLKKLNYTSSKSTRTSREAGLA